MEDYMNAAMVSDPIRLFDCCQESDGACAVIVTTTERARNLKQTPVHIMAGAQGGLWYPNSVNLLDKIADLEYDESRRVAQTLYRMADITPEDIDVAEIYDHFTIHVI